jgi:hypothetical protein
MLLLAINIKNIKVDQLYYSFNFDVWNNGKKIYDNDYYENDHNWGQSSKSIKDFKKLLKKVKHIILF